MRWLLTVFIFIVYQSLSLAQWDIKNIPAVLKDNSDAVVRRYATDVRIYESDKLVVAEDIVITVFNKEVVEKRLLGLIVKEGALGKNFSFKVYDNDGKKIKIYNRASSNKLKSFIYGHSFDFLRDISGLTYPFTFELEYKRTIVGIDDLNTWMPANDIGISIQNASLRVMSNDTTIFQAKSNMVQLVSNSLDQNGFFISIWELNNYQENTNVNRTELIQSKLPFITIERRK